MDPCGFYQHKNTTAFITGATSGMGRRFSKVLARCGAKVWISGRRQDRLESLVAEIQAEGGQAFPIVADLGKTDAREFLKEPDRAGDTINLLVNNAGLGKLSDIGKNLDRSAKFWDLHYQVNLKAPWLLSAAVASRLRECKQPGSIINIASICGTDNILSRFSAYSATKAGLIQMTKALSTELAPDGIRVNAIAPGMIKTEMTVPFQDNHSMLKEIPLGRMGETEDLDGVLLFLASKASAWVTGSVFTIDGGMSVKDHFSFYPEMSPD